MQGEAIDLVTHISDMNKKIKKPKKKKMLSGDPSIKIVK